MTCDFQQCDLFDEIFVFRVTRPDLKLLLKPGLFSGFLEKYNFMHFER